MRQGCLVPNIAEVTLVCLRPKDGAIEMQLRARRSISTCPACGTASRRVHSHYQRKLADLPWEGLPVVILLQARKFFCVGDSCRRKIFTEPLPGTVARYARRSCRSSEALHWLTLALGGRAGARLALRLGLLACRSTLLRSLRHRMQPTAVTAPRVLGIDDWAWRKAHRYGTILCDLEAGKVVDLLPDREAATLAAWLQDHPGTEIVSRDRASAYAEATRRAAPQAVQIADRWHLMRNMSEALRTALEPHHRVLKQAAQGSIQGFIASAPPLLPSSTLSAKQQNRQRRYSLYEEMKALADGGTSQSDIARQLDLSLRTVQRWTRAGDFPERTPRSYPHSVDAYVRYLDQRLHQGCHNVSQLWRELRQQGYRGQLSSVWNWLHQHRGHTKRAPIFPSAKLSIRTSPQHTTWLILKEPPSAKAYLEELYRASPEIAALAHLGREFFRLVRSRDLAAWPQWLERAKHTALRSFASSLLRDQHAVEAALTLPWSNGPVEGHVHRLKLIKRQMYGRASFDLLRLRVLHQA